MSRYPPLGPVIFQREFLRRHLWGVQEQICTAIMTHRRVSVKGCHASGKSYDASGLVPFWLTRYEDGMVLNVAPTLRQVKLFWREVSAAIAGARYPMPEPQTTGVEITKQNYALGFSASKGVNAQGFHAAKGLLIVDEAPGIQAEVWEAIDGILAGGDWTELRLGNPTIPSGPFFDDFGKHKQTCKGFTISAFDTPNFKDLTIDKIVEMNEDQLRGCVLYPSLIRPSWVKGMYEKWGPNSPQYQSRVLGEFPAQSRYSVFLAESVQRAARPVTAEQWKELAHLGPIQVGLDVAGAGDDETAACARIGNVVIAADAWPEMDPKGNVSRFLGNLKRNFPRAQMIVVVDMVGVGYHLGMWLAADGYDVRGFIANGRPLDPTSFHDAKAEAYWTLAEWMRRGIFGVSDEDTKAQLIGIQYRTEHTGAIRIEEKEVMKKRGLSSPDRAEALVMAYALLVPLRQTLTRTEEGQMVTM